MTRNGWTGLATQNFSGANGDKEKNMFPVQLTTSRVGNLTRLIHTLSAIISDDYFKHECMYVWSSSIAECGSTGRVRLPILLVIPTIGMKWAC